MRETICASTVLVLALLSNGLARAQTQPTPTPSSAPCPSIAPGTLYVKFPDRVAYTDSQHMTSSFIVTVHGDGTVQPIIPDTWDIAPMRAAILDFLSQLIICGGRSDEATFVVVVDHATGAARETELLPP